MAAIATEGPGVGREKDSGPVMVDDDLVVDVRGARDAGMRGLLVRTGKFREQDLAGDISAEGVLNSFADLPAWWCEHGGC